jgi:uncharacterized protein YdhG (YjbR/CyaY superfamily)
MKKIFVSMFAVMAGALSVFAQKPAVVSSNKPGWQHIGHTTASFKMQNESISVLGADEFTALKIKVTEAGLELERMQVFYESGDMEEINLKEHFGKGNESRVINLKHPDKDIQKVAFTYKTTPNTKGEKADIDLYGLKTNQPAGSDSFKDEKKEMREDAREVRDDVREGARETRDEVREDARETRDDVREDLRDERDDVREEARETRDEVKEDARETRDDIRYNKDVDTDIEFEEKPDLGDKIEEGYKDAGAAIADKKIKNKVGPGGETAYVNEHGEYYIINNLGEKQVITKLQLKDKPKD